MSEFRKRGIKTIKNPRKHKYNVQTIVSQKEVNIEIYSCEIVLYVCKIKRYIIAVLNQKQMISSDKYCIISTRNRGNYLCSDAVQIRTVS